VGRLLRIIYSFVNLYSLAGVTQSLLPLATTLTDIFFYFWQVNHIQTGTRHHPFHCVPDGLSGVKTAGADHSPPSNAELNAWIYMSS
jgi:hypothetical protein